MAFTEAMNRRQLEQEVIMRKAEIAAAKAKAKAKA